MNNCFRFILSLICLCFCVNVSCERERRPGGSNYSFSLNGNAWNGNLLLNSVSVGDRGNYSCSAINFLNTEQTHLRSWTQLRVKGMSRLVHV